MAKKIYVGNLSFQTTENVLTEMFAELGRVESVQLITDRESGRSKGFGFVQMADDDAVAKAIERFNGKELDGRPLTVNEARPKAKDDTSQNSYRAGRDRERYDR